MKALAASCVLALGTFVPSWGMAGMIAKAGDNFILVGQGPCLVGSHPMFPQGIPQAFSGGYAVVANKSYVVCAALRFDGNVVVLFDDGDVAELPASVFKEDGA